MAITRKDTAALAGVPAPDPEDEQPAAPDAEPEETEETEGEQPEETTATAPLPFISEGIRQELEMHGKATDPVTGMGLVLNRETGEITATLRT